ncbi:MAG: hypothetical protein SVM86_04140 [Candidatus Cloacimonadota bacterium]|nr:hypothetical protein [Candidatus Cloacimonadota bacterium]
MAINNDFQINFENLMKQGYAVIDVRYRDYDITDAEFKYVIIRVERDREDFYKDMLKSYLGKEFETTEIYDVWRLILDHKLKMSDMLKRDVSIKVAALDYQEKNE